MCNNMCLLSGIQWSAIEAVVDLIAELVAAELDRSRWVKLRYQNGKAQRPVGSPSQRHLGTVAWGHAARAIHSGENSVIGAPNR